MDRYIALTILPFIPKKLRLFWNILQNSQARNGSGMVVLGTGENEQWLLKVLARGTVALDFVAHHFGDVDFAGKISRCDDARLDDVGDADQCARVKKILVERRCAVTQNLTGTPFGRVWREAVIDLFDFKVGEHVTGLFASDGRL